MNFLMRSTPSVTAEQASVPEPPAETYHVPKPASSLESLIAEDPYPRHSRVEEHDGANDGFVGENAGIVVPDSNKDSSTMAKHTDVSEEEGWITIPYSMPLPLQPTCLCIFFLHYSLSISDYLCTHIYVSDYLCTYSSGKENSFIEKRGQKICGKYLSLLHVLVKI